MWPEVIASFLKPYTPLGGISLCTSVLVHWYIWIYIVYAYKIQPSCYIIACMKKHRLGNSDLLVSEISLGSWLTYSGGVSREQATACTKVAYDAGINYFDTANVYGKGTAEEAWGEILSAYPRHSYILATKVFYPMSEGNQGLSKEQIDKQINDSLRRLRTDYVDLYYAHRFDINTPIEETMEALSDLVIKGKVRYLGFSEWRPEQIKAGLEVVGDIKFAASQSQYNMLWRSPENEIFPLCEKNNIGQVAWSPLAQGVLTGKYEPGKKPSANSRAASPETNYKIGRFMVPPILEAVQKLRPIAQELNLTMAQLALSWVLQRKEVASALIGASSPEQINENIASVDITLSADILAKIDEALGDVVVRKLTFPETAQEGVKHRIP